MRSAATSGPLPTTWISAALALSGRGGWHPELLVRGELPVGAEHGVEVVDRRAGDARLQIAPALGQRRRPHVLEREVHAADDRGGAVDDDDLAMQPQIRVAPRWQVPHRHEPREARAGGSQPRELFAIRAELEHRVDQQADLDALLGLRDQRVDDRGADLVVADDQRRHVDRSLGRRQRVHHRAKRDLARQMKLDGVVHADRRRARRAHHRRDRAALGDRRRRVQRMLGCARP